jgi:pyruvate/2-oxoglutarate dehydrogenase complex dihydrolipoamide acyltransferase (E2) component
LRIAFAAASNFRSNEPDASAPFPAPDSGPAPAKEGGVVGRIHVAAGATVESNAVLVSFET